jgi:hypothetical protein
LSPVRRPNRFQLRMDIPASGIALTSNGADIHY